MRNHLILNPLDVFFQLSLFIVALLIPVLLYTENYLFLGLLIILPSLLFLLFTFEYNFRFYFIISLFVGFYFSLNLRFQLINIISYILILFFIMNYDSDEFNKFILPPLFKYITFF